jgi:hypothetical protein
MVSESMATSMATPMVVTTDKINAVCHEEITKQLDKYLNDHLNDSEDDIDLELYPVVQDPDDFFWLFMDYTFGPVRPNIFIEVYLPYPLTLEDNVKQEIWQVVDHWLNIPETTCRQDNKLLTYYAEAWAICNKSYLTRYIKDNI